MTYNSSNVDWRLMAGLGPATFTAPTVPGLPEDAQSLLQTLVATWLARYPGNALRQAYLDCKAAAENLGYALPEEVARDLNIVSAWPEKAVFSLANRCHWDGVVSPDGTEEDPWGLSSLLHQNRFSTEVGQSIASAVTNGVSFVVTMPGNPTNGDPEVLVLPFSALTAAALWDRRRRGIKAGLLINDTDYLGRPTELIMLTPTYIVSLTPVTDELGGPWTVREFVTHSLGRTPMEALTYRSSLDRPLGRSRLSRGVLSIVDRSVRTAMRMDVSAELFTAPGILLNGIEEDTFAQIQRSWSWRLGAVKGLTRDEEGELAQVHTLPQQSMQPHITQMQELAMEMAAALSIPVGSLGIVQDNPSSADAIYAAKEELVIEASQTNDTSSYALSRVYQNVIMLRDRLSAPPVGADFIPTHWRNPAMPSIVSQSDAMIKQISAIPDLALTDVALEEFGYTAAQIRRIRGQIRQAQAQRTVSDILATRANQDQDQDDDLI